MNYTENGYDNTIIYKISCKDPTITDIYVGHTINFIKRKSTHKNSCNNVNNSSRLYTFIREHGGWYNWTMEIVNFFKCKDKNEALEKEQEYFKLLNATLNSIEPITSCKKDKLVVSDTTVNISENDVVNDTTVTHDSTQITETRDSTQIAETRDLTQNINYKFICESCTFMCNNKKDYNRHLLTNKHNRQLKLSSRVYKCNMCDNSYKHQSSLIKHRKKCKLNDKPIDKPVDTPVEISETKLIQDMIKELIIQNQELSQQIKGFIASKNNN